MKISNRILSLRGLRTFCVAARHLSFRIAAEELFVTASAVSHQVKSLEEELDVSLFERNKRTLELTETGLRLFKDVDPLIRQIDEVTAPIRERGSRQLLRVSVQPFFASELFVPRFAEFTAQHPDIDLDVDISDSALEKHAATKDISIRLFSQAPADLVSDRLLTLRLVPACSPALLQQIAGSGARPSKPFPVVLHAARIDAWQQWSDASGINIPVPSKIIKLNSMSAVVRAAEQGVGAALVPLPLSEAKFRDKELVRLYDHELVTPDCYYVVWRKGLENSQAVQSLRHWVLENFSEQT